MGAVVAPLLVATGVATLGAAPALIGAQIDEQVLSDTAIAQRVRLALAALATTAPAPAGAGPCTPPAEPAAARRRTRRTPQ